MDLLELILGVTLWLTAPLHGIGRFLRKALRNRGSWPAAQGNVESVNVEDQGGNGYVGELAYSYRVQDERYSGFDRRWYRRERDAYEAVEPFRGKQIVVRYKPGKPEISEADGL